MKKESLTFTHSWGLVSGIKLRWYLDGFNSQISENFSVLWGGE